MIKAADNILGNMLLLAFFKHYGKKKITCSAQDKT